MRLKTVIRRQEPVIRIKDENYGFSSDYWLLSSEVSDYGIYSTSARIKDITVTVHVSFTLR